MSSDPLSGPIEPFPEDAPEDAREPETHSDPVHAEVETHVDPAVAEAVHSVRDRFGTAGLRDLITLAGYELDAAARALASLREEVVEAPPTAEDAAFGSMLAADESGGPAPS